MSNSTSPPQGDPALVYPLQENLVEASVNCLGYGCFFILAIVSLRVLIRRGLSSPGQRYLLAAVIVFLMSSTIYCAARFAWNLAGIVLQVGSPNDTQGALKLVERMYIVTVIFSRLIYLLNDVLVVWRAWVLADRRILHGVLAFSMLVTIGCTIAEAILNLRGGIFAPLSVTANMFFFIPLVFNNVLATSFVLYKTWIYRMHWQIKSDSQEGSRKNQVERVLFLLIESSLIYCGWWALALITRYVQSVPPLLFSIGSALSPFIAAIYPLLIILVVEHQRSQAEQPSARSFSHSLRFNSPPVQSDGQTHSTETQSVSIIQSIVDIQSAQKRSLRSSSPLSTSQVRSTGATSIIQTIVDLQSARDSKKEAVDAEKGMDSEPHGSDLELSV